VISHMHQDNKIGASIAARAHHKRQSINLG
jgi:hypothetical protein